MFFLIILGSFRKSYRDYLQSDDEDFDEENEDQGREGENKEYGSKDYGTNKPSQEYIWFTYVDTVAETTHLPWKEVFDMNIYEFFNTYHFAIQRWQRQKREMEKWRKSH